ncbi:MAG TPA: tRNA pseudouridine(55) synthase TruB [Ignavibacteriaceae bacterium]|nr:tRNA pseudouridine(55) synthase TruB [Ignavibacteriaceae bacterium]
MITKKSNSSLSYDFFSGESILFDKALNRTSFQVVYDVRKITKVKKVGHAGTLDPKASGLLIVCTGRKTKKISSFQELGKTYTGSFILGKTTPSMDSETEPDSEKPFSHISEEHLDEARMTFIGEIEQIPPMYSAVNYGGKKLYKLARKGKVVKRKPRKIQIYEFQITKVDLPEIFFKIVCSKGTYIRVIAHDFGEKLGCGAYLGSLRRTHIGDFSVADAFSMDEFRKFYGDLNLIEPSPKVLFET